MQAAWVHSFCGLEFTSQLPALAVLSLSLSMSPPVLSVITSLLAVYFSIRTHAPDEGLVLRWFLSKDSVSVFSMMESLNYQKLLGQMSKISTLKSNSV